MSDRNGQKQHTARQNSEKKVDEKVVWKNMWNKLKTVLYINTVAC